MPKVSVEATERLNEFYIKILKSSKRIKDPVHEKTNLFLDAFFGLIRNGWEYEVEEKKPQKIKKEQTESDPKKKKTKKEEFFDDDPTIRVEPTRIIAINVGGKYYRCPELDLKYAFGSMYDSVTGEHIKHKTNRNGIDTDDNIFIPDVYAKKAATENSETGIQNQDHPAAVPETKAVIPYIAFDTMFPNDEADYKEYDSFLFNMHETTVRTDDGETMYTSYIYPLSPDTSDCLITDILVVMTDSEGNVRTGMSEVKSNGVKNVTAEFANATFVVRGWWEDGEFISKIAPLSGNRNEIKVDDVSHPVKPSRRTSSFYLRHLEDNGNVLNVFPLGLLRNDTRTGLAPCIMMLEDGQTRTMYMSGNNDVIALTLAKKSVMASAYWAGNALNLSIDKKR